MEKQNPNGYLTISEFAKTAGCSREKLIYYDRIGLLKPDFIGENGYRYYKHNKMETMFVITTLASMNIKLKDIKKYLNLREPDHALELLTNQANEIQKQIDFLQSTKNLIDSRIDHLHVEEKVKLNQPEVVNQNKQFIFVSETFDFPTDKIPGNIWIAFWHECQKRMISCGYPVGYIINQKNLKSKNYKQISQVFVNLNQADAQKANQLLDKSAYVVIYGKSHYGNTDNLYKKLYQYLDHNHLMIDGQAYEEYLIDEFDTKYKDNYLIKISIPVKILK